MFDKYEVHCTSGTVTPLTLLTQHAAMLYVYFMRPKTKLENGKLMLLRPGYLQTVYLYC